MHLAVAFDNPSIFSKIQGPVSGKRLLSNNMPGHVAWIRVQILRTGCCEKTLGGTELGQFAQIPSSDPV